MVNFTKNLSKRKISELMEEPDDRKNALQVVELIFLKLGSVAF